MTQAYVYRGKEVYLTGRSAKKEMRNSTRVVFETRSIKYINNDDDPNLESEWVEMKELYKIDKEET
jgi:hypothetical protein